MSTAAVERTSTTDSAQISNSISKSWKQLEEAQAQGLVKSIGVSNYRVQDLEELLSSAKVVPAVNQARLLDLFSRPFANPPDLQIEFNPLLHKTTSPLLAFAKAKGIALASYAPLNPLTGAKGKNPKLASVVGEIAAKKGWTEGQVLLKWNAQVTGGIVVT
jgi:diketogulonate reductase-like aldo/keto reductase